MKQDGLEYISAMGAAMLATRLAKGVWRASTGHEAPVNPADRGTSWREALLFSAVVGAFAGVAKVVARRTIGAATGETAEA